MSELRNPDSERAAQIRSEWGLIGPTPFSLVDRCPNVRKYERALRAEQSWNRIRVLHDYATMIHRDVVQGISTLDSATRKWSIRLSEDILENNPKSITAWVATVSGHSWELAETIRFLEPIFQKDFANRKAAGWPLFKESD